MNKSKHYLFLLSPFLFFLAIIIVPVFDESYEIFDMLITVFKGYTVAYFLISSYVFFRIRRAKLTSGWDVFIRNGYPVSASIIFAWFILLPLMEKTLGMWDIEFINQFITLALSFFLFYWVIGFYEIGYSIVGKEPPSFNKKNNR